MKKSGYFKKDKIILICDWFIEFCFYLIIFTSIFSKAAVESFFGIACLAYLIKKFLSYLDDRRLVLLPSTKLSLPILVFIVVNIISIFFSKNFLVSFKYFFTMLFENVLFYFMAAEIILLKKDKKKFFIEFILLASVIIVIDAAFQYFIGKDVLRHFAMSGRRLTASLGSPNTFAAWLILVTPLICCITVMKKIKKIILRIGMLILSFLLILCIFLSYSRGAWVGFFCGMLFIILFNDKRMLQFFLILMTLFVGLVLFYPNSITVVKGEYADYPILIRLNLWNEAMGIIKDYPLFGVGIRNYLTVVPKYQIHKFNMSIDEIGESTGISPHNGYLQMAAETGLIGLACFIWILWALFNNGIKHLKMNLDPVLLGLLSGLLAFLVSAFFDNHLNKVDLSAMFWIMLGLVGGLLPKPHIQKKETG